MCARARVTTGDEIVEWAGSSLEDATFEDTRHIIGNSGDKVQLMVLHHRCARNIPPPPSTTTTRWAGGVAN